MAATSPERRDLPLPKTTGGRHVPSYRLYLDGADAPPAVAEDLHEIFVEQATDRADSFALTLANERHRWSDAKTLRPGTKVRIELGYREDRTYPVLDGEVVSWKAVYPRRGPSILRVQGFSRYHRLERPRLTRAWPAKSKFSDIARKIADEVGLGCGVEDSGLQHETVFQHNQTNLRFLVELARRIGFECFVSEGKLFFRRPRLEKGKRLALTWKENLIGFRWRSSIARVPTAVDVRSFDPGRKLPSAGGAASGVEPPMGGTITGPTLAGRLGQARQRVVFEVLRRDEEAKTLAEATLRRAAVTTVHAEAVCQGEPRAQAGLVVEVAGVSPDLCGLYYIERATQSLLPAGYTTTLHLVRTSLGQVKAPPPVLKPAPPPRRRLPPRKAPPAPHPFAPARFDPAVRERVRDQVAALTRAAAVGAPFCEECARAEAEAAEEAAPPDPRATALVQALEAAAKDGTPFCEECARPAAAPPVQGPA